MSDSNRETDRRAFETLLVSGFTPRIITNAAALALFIGVDAMIAHGAQALGADHRLLLRGAVRHVLARDAALLN